MNPPDVANIWIGDSRSITSLHKDPYENIYLVIRGSKTFTLLPPTEFYSLHEKLFTHAQYVYTPSFTTSPSTSSAPPTSSSSSSSFSISKTKPELKIPWIPVDPTSPNLDRYPRFQYAKPITITLEAGDMLYLPSLWFHRVSQKSGSRLGEEEEEEGQEKGGGGKKEVEAAIAVNWWFDMDMQGAHWSLNQFIRRSVLALDGREEESGLLDD